MEQLPDDMLYEIFNRLDNRSLKDLCMVCKSFNSEVEYILKKRRKLKTMLKTWHFLTVCPHWDHVFVFEGEQQMSIASNPGVKTTIGYDDFVFVRSTPIRSR